MHTKEYLKENEIDIDKSLELLGDLETYDDILQEFYDNIEERKSKLQEYLNTSNMKEYATEVHALKSDSKYLGFTKLADLALEHQTKSENNEIEYISSHYEELNQELTKILNIIKKYIEG